MQPPLVVKGQIYKIVIEAVFGLGEAIVGGEVTPDLYVIDKEGLDISSKKIAKQETQLIRNPATGDKEANTWVPVSPDMQTRQKATDDEIIELAKLGQQIAHQSLG